MNKENNHGTRGESNIKYSDDKTSADMGGELLEMEATYNTAVDKVPGHYHPYQDEHIEVLAGIVSVHIKGQECNAKTRE